MAHRALFSSKLATVLTMVGVAVGLGNVWRFPYMMGRFGGSAFLIVYLVFVFAFALPALMGEWALGRETRHGPYGALTRAFGGRGRGLGMVLLVTVFIANSYYLVVVANVAFTAGFSIVRGFDGTTAGAYRTGLANGPLQAGIGLAIIASAMFVLYRGLRAGIERVSKTFVPVFGIVVIYLIVSSLATPGALGHLVQFLRPDFRSLDATSVFAAMGQAFFSLSLGGTFYLIYGSYLRDEESIPGSATLTALGDVGAALLAALFIVPTTLVFGIDLQTGPGLIFETLPTLFAQIAYGRVLGSAFLVALWMVAYLSSIAAFQVVLGAMLDSFGFDPRRAVITLGAAEGLIMIPTALHPALIGPLDLIFGSGMQVIGSGLALVALTWGLGRAVTIKQVFGHRSSRVTFAYYVWIRWVVPGALLITLTAWLLDTLRP